MIIISIARQNDMLHIDKYAFIFSFIKKRIWIYSNCPCADFIATESSLTTIKLKKVLYVFQVKSIKVGQLNMLSLQCNSVFIIFVIMCIYIY